MNGPEQWINHKLGAKHRKKVLKLGDLPSAVQPETWPLSQDHQQERPPAYRLGRRELK